MGRRWAAWLLAPLMLVGCTVGPNFTSPRSAVPAAWAGPATPSADEQRLARWWTLFKDPALTSLIARAVESNLDLRLAESRIVQARAARDVALSGAGPAVGASSSYQRSQSASAGPSRTPVRDQFVLGFDAAWELDVFGRVRRSVEAADADLLAATELRRDLLVSLTAEVAGNYIALRAYQQRIAIAQRNLKAQQRSAELTRKRKGGGFVSGLDVANADAQVATTAAAIPLLDSAARQTIHNLSVLLGREPSALTAELSAAGEIPVAPPEVPVGVPSELLRRRPDIRVAEADIRAATARIGVAVADLYPRFTLSGSLGFQASDLGSMFNPLSRFWSFGPGVTWNLFNSGQNLANIDIQKALQEQTIVAYRQTVLAALQEVENALVASAREQDHRKALIDAVAANRKAVELATQLYTQGETDFLNVLSAQRSLYGSEDALADSDRAVSADLVALYKALGGGWQEYAPTQPAPAPTTAPTAGKDAKK